MYLCLPIFEFQKQKNFVTLKYHTFGFMNYSNIKDRRENTMQITFLLYHIEHTILRLINMLRLINIFFEYIMI